MATKTPASTADATVTPTDPEAIRERSRTAKRLARRWTPWREARREGPGEGEGGAG